jgi:hypothetical protein
MLTQWSLSVLKFSVNGSGWMWKEEVVAYLRNYPELPRETDESHEIISQDSLCPSQDSNQAPLKC